MNIKRFSGNILRAASVICGAAYVVHNFVAEDGISYFSHAPYSLLTVAAIAIVGGLVALSFSVLSPRLRHAVELAALAGGGILVMLAGSYLSYQVVNLQIVLQPSRPPQIPWALGLLTLAVAALIWLEFYRTLRSN